MAAEDPIMVLTTAGSREEAASIAASLVESRLAACVQVVSGVESVYRWEGEVTRDAEWLLLCKTTEGRFAELERAVRESHSYATPEIVAFKIERGSGAYLDWLRQSVL